MKKYRCECLINKCEFSTEKNFYPSFCPNFSSSEPEWHKVNEEEKVEVKAEELPCWCKVGNLVYCVDTSDYCEVVDVDLEKGVRIKTDPCNGWVNFYDLLEARLRPFNEKEMCELLGKAITNKTSEEVFLVTYFNKGYIGLGNLCLTAKELLNEYTMSNGSPCGVYEHLEKGEWVE